MVDKELWILLDAKNEMIATIIGEKSDKHICPLLFRNEREAWEYVLLEMPEDIKEDYAPHKMQIIIKDVTFGDEVFQPPGRILDT